MCTNTADVHPRKQPQCITHHYIHPQGVAQKQQALLAETAQKLRGAAELLEASIAKEGKDAATLARTALTKVGLIWEVVMSGCACFVGIHLLKHTTVFVFVRVRARARVSGCTLHVRP